MPTVCTLRCLRRVLRAHGVNSLFGGEFEQSLVDLAEHLSGLSALAADSSVGFKRIAGALAFSEAGSRRACRRCVPTRIWCCPCGEHRIVGYTEASRGCKHLCRHCPIVPVYNGVFRIVDREVVLADIRQQVAAGAQHITFGDPDFFNGVGHAIPLVEALHREFPAAHLRRHHQGRASSANMRNCCGTLRATGCLFIVSAVESLDDEDAARNCRRITRVRISFRVVEECRRAGITLQPTFVPFTPWTTFEWLLGARFWSIATGHQCGIDWRRDSVLSRRMSERVQSRQGHRNFPMVADARHCRRGSHWPVFQHPG